ncbi:hypothetical protein IscW_ISCW010747 [Ixodes scapularis]|uniref:Reverse transcriptase domain-containing protein n=1 Tax=Ixodes scapularis TaxID=6945 RepID=B7Q7N7_IXOSC|nr:hypothetical protein IscW_ISCW010747 [Ixodes scapularis]|eukprot:XP_002404264.1 hypothetical protein IscW_ISCW010747 [Ixodes scapularis]
MALHRLNWHLEHHNHLVPTMVGFRSLVSSQDVALRIQEDVYAFPSTAQLGTVGVDIKKAFDNVDHATIFTNLVETFSPI